MTIRLKGDDLRALRLACFMLSDGRCTRCGKKLYFTARFAGDPDAYDMSHKRNKRMHGDSLDNVESLCHRDHMLQHSYGKSYIKPVPSKRGLNAK